MIEWLIIAFLIGVVVWRWKKPPPPPVIIRETEVVREVDHETTDRLLANLNSEWQAKLNGEKERSRQSIMAAQQEWSQQVKKIREDAIARHKNTMKGKVTEHLIPYFDDFEFNPSDCRFLGSPVDLIIFDGLSDGELKQIVFVEIKTGKQASLTTRERQIRNVVGAKNISWKLIRKGV